MGASPMGSVLSAPGGDPAKDPKVQQALSNANRIMQDLQSGKKKPTDPQVQDTLKTLQSAQSVDIVKRLQKLQHTVGKQAGRPTASVMPQAPQPGI